MHSLFSSCGYEPLKEGSDAAFAKDDCDPVKEAARIRELTDLRSSMLQYTRSDNAAERG